MVVKPAKEALGGCRREEWVRSVAFRLLGRGTRMAMAGIPSADEADTVDLVPTSEKASDEAGEDSDDDLLVEQAQQVVCFGRSIDRCFLQQLVGASLLVAFLLAAIFILIWQLWP